MGSLLGQREDDPHNSSCQKERDSHNEIGEEHFDPLVLLPDEVQGVESQLLSKGERELVETVVKIGKLPEDTSDDLIRALNNLFENLKVVAVNVDEMFDYLTQESDVLTLDELTQRFEKFKDEKLSGLDPSNVRFRIQKRSSNGANKTG